MAEKKVFVGNLSWKTTDNAFSDFFQRYGELADVCVLRKEDGQSRGFGFVTFRDPAVADRLLRERNLVLDDRKIDCKLALPKDKDKDANTAMTFAPPPSRPTQSNNRGSAHKLYVGGLEADATLPDLDRHFSRFGRIVDSIVMTERETGKPRGFGFVTYDNPSSVDICLSNAPHHINGKEVDVKRAVPKDKGNMGRGNSPGRDGGDRRRGSSPETGLYPASSFGPRVTTAPPLLNPLLPNIPNLLSLLPSVLPSVMGSNMMVPPISSAFFPPQPAVTISGSGYRSSTFDNNSSTPSLRNDGQGKMASRLTASKLEPQGMYHSGRSASNRDEDRPRSHHSNSFDRRDPAYNSRDRERDRERDRGHDRDRGDRPRDRDRGDRGDRDRERERDRDRDRNRERERDPYSSSSGFSSRPPPPSSSSASASFERDSIYSRDSSYPSPSSTKDRDTMYYPPLPPIPSPTLTPASSSYERDIYRDSHYSSSKDGRGPPPSVSASTSSSSYLSSRDSYPYRDDYLPSSLDPISSRESSSAMYPPHPPPPSSSSSISSRDSSYSSYKRDPYSSRSDIPPLSSSSSYSRDDPYSSSINNGASYPPSSPSSSAAPVPSSSSYSRDGYPSYSSSTGKSDHAYNGGHPSSSSSSLAYPSSSYPPSASYSENGGSSHGSNPYTTRGTSPSQSGYGPSSSSSSRASSAGYHHPYR